MLRFTDSQAASCYPLRDENRLVYWWGWWCSGLFYGNILLVSLWATLLAQSKPLAQPRAFAPAGLFSYHPYLQSLAVVGFAEGVLLLQPQPKNQAVKQKGLKVHQAVQSMSSALIVAGAVVIIYNKVR